MSDPVWTPILGDSGSPSTPSAIALETADRIAADALLQLGINSVGVSITAEIANRIAGDAVNAAAIALANAAIGAESAARAAADLLKQPLQGYPLVRSQGCVINAGGTEAFYGVTAGSAGFGPGVWPGNVFGADPTTGIIRGVRTSDTPANSASGWLESNKAYVRGNLAGRGGFTTTFYFSPNAVPASTRLFIGLSSSFSLITFGDPSASNTVNQIAVGKNAADTNWQLMSCNATTYTKVDLGVAPIVGHLYVLTISCVPNSTSIQVSFVDFTSGVTIFNGSVSTTIPLPTVYLAAQESSGHLNAGVSCGLDNAGYFGTANV